MRVPCRAVVRLGAVGLAALAPALAWSQQQRPPKPIVSKDSVSIAAGTHYDAGEYARWWLGNTYRDYWMMPVKVPVLNLERYAGGLKPLKEGGGMQTINLRLAAPDGSEWVFRPVNKAKGGIGGRFRGTIIQDISRDQTSALYPAASLIAAPIVGAAGVLHATPTFVVMPNDESMGKFRKDFINQLGTLEEYPNKPDDAPGFAGAADVIDSEDLLPMLDSVPGTTVDTRAFLRARLTDALISDLDRHHQNWKWARFGPSETAVWVPIPRDRDHAFHTYDGFITRVGSMFATNLTRFEAKYEPVKSLSSRSRNMDQRLLAGLEKPVWDSIARDIQRRITDAVIDSALGRTPAAYRATIPSFTSKLRQRRDGLAAYADRFYAELAQVVDVHATDKNDRATVLYNDDGSATIVLRSGDQTYFRRRFLPRETREVRVYLHDGDDSAIIRGYSPIGVPVRIIGGNGTNQLVDSTGARGRLARLYDQGAVTGVNYGPDSLRDSLFNRRPWVRDTGDYQPRAKDFGSAFKPSFGFGGGSGLGITPKVGLAWVSYGFMQQPYATKIGLEAAYSTRIGGYRLTAFGDHRFAQSRMHVMATGRMSDFEVVNFYGFGNNTEEVEPEEFYEARQRQWSFEPALAFSLIGRESDITLGPVIQYSTTDSITNKFLTGERPYGFGDFGQAGARLGIRWDRRNYERYASRGFLIDASSSYFPNIWDVQHTFSTVGGSAATYLELPLPKHPVIALRGGGKKVFGDAPFHEAAFLGGRGTIRAIDADRYAGDASLFGTTELRVPFGRVPFWVPLDIGALGFVDAGRVWVDTESPGGWHTIAGGGLWFGIIDPGTGFSVMLTNSSEKRVLIGTGLRF
jgi:hypothetical protein